MGLINPGLVMTIGGVPLTGWTFAILGAYDEEAEDYLSREQGNNPVFTADQQNQPLVVGVTYQLTMFHPDYTDRPKLVQGMFATNGLAAPGDPAETPPLPLLPDRQVLVTLSPDAQAGDILGLVINPDSGLLEVKSTSLLALLTEVIPELRYGLGLGVNVTQRPLFDTDDFDPVDFETNQ